MNAHFIKFLKLNSLSFIFIFNLSFAQNNHSKCNDSFFKINTHESLLKHLQKRKNTEPNFLKKTSDKKNWLEEEKEEKSTYIDPLSLNHYTPTELQDFDEWLSGHYFEDPKVLLEDNYFSKTLPSNKKGPKRYDKQGERPFDGYLKARKYLSYLKAQDLSLNTILETNRHLLSKESIRASDEEIQAADGNPKANSGGARDNEMGVIRKHGVGFKFNPHSPEENEHWRKVEKDNPFLFRTANGHLSYAPIEAWRHFQDQLPPERIKELELLEATYPRLDIESEEINEVRKKMIEDLVKSSLNKLRVNLVTAKTKGEVTHLVADFQHELLSIHPFDNGNGRTARILSEKILQQHGIPPPIWIQWGEDISRTKEEFQSDFLKAVNFSHSYHEEAQELAKLGVSPYDIPNPYLYHYQKQQSEKGKKFSPEEFMTWVKLKKERFFSVEDALSRFMQFTDSNHLVSNYTEYPLPSFTLSPEGYRTSFGRLSNSQTEFLNKRDRYYTNTKIYRGTPIESSLSPEEVASLFARPASALTGNSVPIQAQIDGKSGEIIQKIEEERVNDSKKFSNRISNHAIGSFGGVKYHNSNLVSYSLDRDLAHNWAVNIMDYSKLGLLVTARLPKSGHLFTPSKMNWMSGVHTNYPRENEVVLFAGTDPESILEVQTPSNSQNGGLIIGERKSWDTVEVRTELAGEVKNRTLYHIEKNGTVTKLSEEKN